MFSLFKRRGVLSPPSRRIYLDHAAATPMSEVAVTAMGPYWRVDFGNASAIHTEGVRAKRALETARTEVARSLGVQSSGVIFTSGGTESNNLALQGVCRSLVLAGQPYGDQQLFTTAIEHPATLRTSALLREQGVGVVTVPVTILGQVNLTALRALLTKQTVLVSVSYVNSEVGAITDTYAIRRLLDQVQKKFGTNIYLHVDAAQAPLWLPCDLPRLGADLLSLDGGKFGGPKGVGVLAVRKHVALAGIFGGGGQEQGLRPGTEPLSLIVGLAAALNEAQTLHQARAIAVAQIRDYFFTELARELPTAVFNGPPSGSARVANNVHISIPGLDSEYAVIVLDAHGIAASTKSACSSRGGGESAVVLAMTGDSARAASTLRFTLGSETTLADVDWVVAKLKEHLQLVPNFDKSR